MAPRILTRRPKVLACIGHCCWTGSWCSGLGVPQLTRKCVVATALAWACSMVLSFTGLILAILPWLRAPDVPRAAVYPVFIIVFGKSTELATLLGIPIGLALGANKYSKARPVKIDGVTSPLAKGWRLELASICALGAILGVFTLACVNYWSLTPGRMARSALATARDRCLAEPGVPGVAIPVLGATWTCAKSGLPRLEGPLPGSHHRAWFSAGNVQVSDDLLTVDLEDVRLGMRPSGAIPKVQLRTPHASVHGVRAVFRPAHLGPWLRAMLGVGTGLLLGGLAAYQILIKGWTSRLFAWTLSATSATCACTVLLAVDTRASSALTAYLWVPLVGLFALFCANAFIVHRARRSASVAV